MTRRLEPKRLSVSLSPIVGPHIPKISVYNEDDDVFIVNKSEHNGDDKENHSVPGRGLSCGDNLSGSGRLSSRKRSLNVSPSIPIPPRKSKRSSNHLEDSNTRFLFGSNCSEGDGSPAGVCVNSPGRERIQTLGLESFDDIKLLGKGSYGMVVLGKWRGNRVAVKVIPHRNSQVSHRRRLESVKSEFNLQDLNHENIVKVHGVFANQDENAVVVMEYVGKSNLQTILVQSSHQVDIPFIERCTTEIARALSYCHSKGIVHLDVKPGNIFVTSKGQCKLGDFGCSKKIQETDSSANAVSTAAFVDCIGTPGYQAPELLGKNAVLSAKCDVFSFGIFLWQLAAKESPYAGIHPHVIIFKVVSQGIRPSEVRVSMPEWYRRLYRQCWSQDPQNRPLMETVLASLTENMDNTRRRRSNIRI